MLKTLLICIIVSGLTVSCANGWPRVHTPPRTAANCIPTGSKIDRQDCGTSNPGNSASQDDIDRGPGNLSIAPPPTLGSHH